jgi:predicted DNA-binding protein
MAKSQPMQRINLYMPKDQIKRLESVSERTGAPIAELIRRAVEAYLKRL